MAFNGSFWSFKIAIIYVDRKWSHSEGQIFKDVLLLVIPCEKIILLGEFLKNFPDFSDISIFEIVTDLHFFSYDLFIVRFFQFLSKFRELKTKKLEFLKFFLWFFCAAEMILAAWKLINGKVRRVLNWRE